jgi:hypothetical protein
MANNITEIGLYVSDIPSYPDIETVSYENFFKLHLVNNEFAFFNLLKKINILTNTNDVDPSFFITYNIDVDVPWVLLSYKVYGTLNLWWLLCLVNNIQDATKNPALGTQIKAIKPQFVASIVNQINIQLRV